MMNDVIAALSSNAYWTSEYQQLDGKSADGLRKVYAEGVDRESYPTFEGWVWDMERSGIVFRHEEERNEMNERYVWVVSFYEDEKYNVVEDGVRLFATKDAALGWLGKDFRLTRSVGCVEFYEARYVEDLYGEQRYLEDYVKIEKQEVRTGNK